VIDVNTLIGPYPYRHVPHPDPEALIRVLDREEIEGAWVGHLPSAFYRDPTAGNAALYSTLEPFAHRLKPIPSIRPDWPNWSALLDEANRAGAPAVRAYPQHWGLAPGGAAASSLIELAAATGELGLALMLTVRFEDLRQRHPMDSVGDLAPSTIRRLARAGDSVRLVVTAASRDIVEEVHWGLTPEEQRRVFWDISWIWGPPEDHLSKLFRTVGAPRFVFGSQWPLRLVQTPRANLDLLDDDVAKDSLADAREICRAATRA
jgi:hypothetical protein